RCMTYVAYLFSRFLHVESCNQCPPCKLGSGIITEALERLLGGAGSLKDLNEIRLTTEWVENGKRCYLPTSEALVISSIDRDYAADFANHADGNRCPLDHTAELPKIVDYSETEGFTYDKLYARKQPDWT